MVRSLMRLTKAILELVVWIAVVLLIASTIQLVRGTLAHNNKLIKEGLYGSLAAFGLIYLRLDVILRSSYNPLSPDYLKNVQRAFLFGGRMEILRQQRQVLLLMVVFAALATAAYAVWKL